MILRTRTCAVICLAIGTATSLPASAQKNSGPLLPIEAPRARATPPTYAPRRAPEPSAQQPGRNPQVEQLSERLPLDPQTREMRDQLPPDTRDIQRRLGLRPARGPVTDLRGHTPTPREIANALAPR